MRRKRGEVTERHKRVASSYLKGGKTLEQAMADEGFSPDYGRKGIQNVARSSAPFVAAFNEEIENLTGVDASVDITPEQARKLVSWRLALNVVRGEDKGVHSAKLMGARKDVDMFVRFGADGATGIFVGLLGQEAKDMLDKLDAALPKSEAATPPISGESQS